ncbi:hypothetical protein EJ04DRAFT_513277 [Polyplosphaeria fusca]|uniref:Uncharacterized protein n=1 Tax=Polyplosphaeria fusca TaxID=682080 RepID=A0A9P4QVL3_9PLEO|nr:hypothetical protein EJ04DRAFT_513277 [Polyplosphaeria fusca]
MSHYPFIAALMWPASGPRIGMQIMHLPDPTNKTMGQNPGNCPAGFVCTADSWDVKQEAEGRGSRTVLKYGGFGGAWVAVKDEAPEGWSVYWDAETGGAGYVRGTKIELIVNAVKVGGD